ncbi:ribosomal protein S18-alanine N-acetyltransferase [Halomonas shantousis]
MHIERLTHGHLAALVAIEQAGQASPWSAALLEAALADERSEIWGACRQAVTGDAGLAGFAVLHWLPFEAELQAITVSPDSRRQGVGRHLLTKLIELAMQRGSERLLLEVRQSNAPALKLYETAGFQVDGHRRGYYSHADGSREDAVLMSRDLAP